MPTYGIGSVESVTFYNRETGEEVMYSSNMDTIESVEFNTSKVKDFSFCSSKQAEFTLKINEVDQDAMKKLIGHKSNSELAIKDIQVKQIRTHKKKRINKKWAKIYGYTKYIYIEYR